jgi:hypothetical protein
MVFARRVFRVAGIYGLVALLPQLFLEERIGRDNPPAITHPEYFYSFLLVTIVWQIAFLVIANDPVRFRPLMPVAVLEKWPFALTMFGMVAAGRVTSAITIFAAIDVLLGVLFLVSWFKTAGTRD